MKNVMLLVALVVAAAAFGDLPDGWTPKFYDGLEAVGSVEWIPKGYKEKEGAIRCAWESGAMKFGAAKEVTTEFSGWIDWTVEAHVMSEGDYGYAGAAMEFLDANGRSAGLVSQLRPIVSKGGWRKVVWMFSSPKDAKRSFVHLLSLDKEPVRFANVKITSKQGADKGDIPFEVMALPAEKNRWWTGGEAKTLNFSDAPIPTVFYMKGAKKGRDRLRLVVDVPAELELKDAYCPNSVFYEAVRPLETCRVFTNGADCIRYSFGDLKLFKSRLYGSLSPARYFNDECSGLALVLGPKAGQEDLVKTFRIGYRMTLGDKCGEEKSFDMKFRPLPRDLKRSRDFFVFSWCDADRNFSSDVAALAAARAYEAAGVRSVHRGKAGSRRRELTALWERRPDKYVFSASLPNVWLPSRTGLDGKAGEAFGVRMSVSSDPRYASFARGMCPEYFTRDEKLRAHLREFIRKTLAASGVKNGDWVTFDMEPWHSSTYCHCDVCHKAFAEFAGLDHVPTAEETQSSEELCDKWALFRCSHNAKSIELMVQYIHEYNPTLKCIDYDYVMPYGDEKGMMARRRSVGKDTLVNEQWLDGHLCSYYHMIDKAAFDAIRNDTRHLKKFYVPMGANDGAGGYLTPAEVLNPKQVRQLALAAFVHGCPGIAFYSGICYDGGYLLGLMNAQSDIAVWEDLPWGKIEGKIVPTCTSAQFAYASTVRPDGGEVLALFNYDAAEPITVTVSDMVYELKPYETKFVEVRPRNRQYVVVEDTAGQRDWRMPFKLGVAGFTMRRKSLDETLEILQALDLHYLCVKDFHLTYTASDAEIRAFKAKCAMRGVTAYGLGPLYTKDDESVRKYFEFAKRFGAKVIVGVPYEQTDEMDSWNKRKGSRKQLEYIDKLVKEFDIRYAIHNHGPNSPEMYPDVAYGWNLIKDLDRRIGFCLDVGWEFGADHDPATTIRQFGDRIYDVHLKNFAINLPGAQMVGGKSFTTVPMPRGKIDYGDVFRALAEIGYSGVCSFEYERDFENNFGGLAESVGYARGICDMIKDPPCPNVSRQ